MPASCGELVQGLLDGQQVLVSCPIARRVRIRLWLTPTGSGRVSGLDNAPKAARALRRVLGMYTDGQPDAEVELLDPLPRGKGMASSTADVAGVIAAALRALGRPVDPATVGAIAAGIEPTDSTLCPGLSLFDYRRGVEIAPLGGPPPMRVLMLDWGGRLNSVAFNRRAHESVLAANSGRFREAVTLVADGVRDGDPARIGAGASLSARLHQTLLPRPWLEPSLAFCRRVGGLGVNIAHSGTVTGILLPDDPERIAHAEALARRELTDVKNVATCRLVAGGYQLADLAPSEQPSTARSPSVSR